MEEKDIKYHIKISARFLLGIKLMKKFYHLKWIYVYIKLKYNYYLQHKPNDSFKLDVDEISEFLGIHKTIVFTNLKRLTNYGLLSKGKRGKYIIKSEEEFIKIYKKNNYEDPNSKDPFLKIYNNEFMNLWCAGVKAKEALLYYYMVNENRHHLENEQWLKVNVNQHQTCKALEIDHRTYKRFVKHLISIGYLKKDDAGKLYTKTPKPVELLKKKAAVPKYSTVNTNENTETTFKEEWELVDEKSIDSKMKLSPELGSIEKKRKLYEYIKYPVVEWKICRYDSGDYVIPEVNDPINGPNLIYATKKIPANICAEFGVDVAKCKRLGHG